MSLTENGMSPADYAAINNNGWGGGDGAWWLLVLFLFAFNGGWGNGNGGYNGGFYGDMQRGFDQASVMSGINGIQTSLSNGFANAEVAECNRAMNAMQTAYTNQIADLQAQFASQTALANQLNGITASLQNCCCENRAGIADLKYTIATEACADRAAVNEGVRDIIANQTASTQAVLDKLCQQEIDALKAQNANLQTQVNLANLTASQTAQTSKILADNAAQTAALEQYLNPAPIPAYTVQNPNCCAPAGCGCGL